MTEIIFATSNDHKVYEVQQLISSYPITFKSLKDIEYFQEIEENGNTMHENALIKAKTIFDLYGVPVFAEDSGLEVHAIDNEPGLFTARYAGPERNHNANMDLVLHNLQAHEDRSARFRAVFAYIDDTGEYYFEGIINGKIAHQKMGNDGFGYDPIFIPKGYEDTFAELGDDVKSQISHRSKAMNLFLQFLTKKHTQK